MNITKTIRGIVWNLIDKDGKPVEAGSTHVDFRGNSDIINDGEPPHKTSNEGHVITGTGDRYYAGVFEMQWIKGN